MGHLIASVLRVKKSNSETPTAQKPFPRTPQDREGAAEEKVTGSVKTEDPYSITQTNPKVKVLAPMKREVLPVGPIC